MCVFLLHTVMWTFSYAAFFSVFGLAALFTNIFETGTRIKTVYFFIRTCFCFSQNFKFCYKVVYIELR